MYIYYCLNKIILLPCRIIEVLEHKVSKAVTDSLEHNELGNHKSSMKYFSKILLTGTTLETWRRHIDQLK